ncbi:MAG: diacylglycerol kinase [Magnetococcales bacterium]|nr:diacylglycerol kinase [Magnetococcales bacterium]
MNHKKLEGMTHFIKAFQWSLLGFKAAWQNETAFRQEVMGMVVLIPLGVWLGDTPLERAALVVSLLFVLVVELINSAIEAVVDRVGLENHPLSGRAKDLGSAAVFVALAISAVVWMAVVFTKL